MSAVSFQSAAAADVSRTGSRWALAWDIGERVLVTALCVGIVYRFLPQLPHHLGNLLIVMSEMAMAVAILLRKPARSADFRPWAVAVALVGTMGGLLVTPGGAGILPQAVGAWLILGGFLLNISAKISLNRSFGVLAANRGVKRRGAYRLVRHPMYAGYILAQATFLSMNLSIWNVTVYAAAWTAQLLRIRAEEQLLMQDEAYRAYAAETRWRLIPGIY